jgi:hypothetical protein
MAILLAGCQDYDLVEREDGEWFTQQTVENQTDVLFVVDDSASMVEEQTRLAGNFGSFFAAVGEAEADWHIGVVTTDVERDDAGLLRGGVLGPGQEQAAIAALGVGVAGSRTEQGFEAARMALDGRNPGFLRDGARLNVVFFSDEDDLSFGSPAAFVEPLVARGSSGGSTNFAVHGVVGDLPGGCASGSSAAEPGPRYVEAIELTGGWRDSICADDYTELLTRVGFEAAGLQDTFPLAAVPQVDSIEVLVDEVVIPPREVDGWTYAPGDNAIVFHGRAIPRPGMEIAVLYEPLAGAN